MISSLQNDLFKSDIAKDRIGFLKITALWAFSESAFGGILHALTIPLRGLFISSAAVLFISLIALFSKNNKDILKSTLIVILIKAIVSPHSPLTAYFAVSIQGFLGFLLFSTKKFYRLSALLLGISVLFLSGMQKIVVLTILFGNTLWESLNIFIKQVSMEMFNIDYPQVDYGFLIMGAYVFFHLLAGLFIGIYAGKLPSKIKYYKNHIPPFIDIKDGEEIPKKKKRKKKIWYLRPTWLLIIALSVGVIIISYLSPELEKSVALSVIIMIIRSLVITFIWFVIVAPIVESRLQKFFEKRKSKHSMDLEEIISMFPHFKEIINYCWKLSNDKNGVKRIRYFLSTSFYYLLLSK